MAAAVEQGRRPGKARRGAKQARRGQAMAAHIQLNRNITAAAERGQEAVLDIVQRHSHEMSLVNVSTAWHCIARMEEAEEKSAWDADPRVAMLQHRTEELLVRFQAAPDQEEPHPRCVATITWSCAKLRISNLKIMAALGDLSVHWLNHFKSFELVNVLWGFAKLQVHHATFLQLAHDHIMGCSELFSTRSLSMGAWAFATIRFRATHDLMSKMADSFAAGLNAGDDANPVTIANMVWALATSRAHVHKAALEAMSRAAASALEHFKVHELSVTLWAFARLSSCQETLFLKAARLLCGSKRLREEIHSQGIANLLWAFARAGQELISHELLGALLPTCLRLMPKLNSVEISSSVWAIARLVSHSGLHPVADRIFVQAARGLLADPGLLVGMSPHGASGVLAAYTEFFSTVPAHHVPAPCRSLITQLTQFCAYFKPEAGEEDHPANNPSSARVCAGSEKSAMDVSVPVAAEEPAFVQLSSDLVVGDIRLAELDTPAKVEAVCAAGPSRTAEKAPGPAALRGLPEHGEEASVSFVDEFGWNEGTDDDHVEVAFQLDRGTKQERISHVKVDTYDPIEGHDSMLLEVEEEDEEECPFFKIWLTKRRENWHLRISALSDQGDEVGKPAWTTFPGKPQTKRLPPLDFADASTSACTETGCSSASGASDSDPETSHMA